jgi:DNA-binding transcriptional LysR family regulator
VDAISKYRCLLVVAKCGNFSVAAHDLNISQPALTRSIQVLEKSVGARLVDRSGKGATLTPMGELVAAEAEAILRDVDDLDHEVDQIKGVEAGHLLLGAGPLPAMTLMPELLCRIGREYPGLHVQFEIGGWRLLTRRLKQRRLDLVVAEASEAETDLELDVTLLQPRPASVVMRKGHPLESLSPVTPAAMGNFPMVTLTLPPRIVATLQGIFGIRWRPTVQCDDVRLLVDLVKSSDSITILSLDVVADQDELVAVPLEEAPMESRFGMIRLSGRTPSQAVRIAMDRLLAVDRQAWSRRVD